MIFLAGTFLLVPAHGAIGLATARLIAYTANGFGVVGVPGVMPCGARAQLRRRDAMGDLRFHALLQVQDEADIIGRSLRHMLTWADAIYVFDAGSVDDTWEIVQNFARKDPRVIVLKPDAVYRETMQWPATHSFPCNAGYVARERLPIRHYRRSGRLLRSRVGVAQPYA